jgi:hypothetical protein
MNKYILKTLTLMLILASIISCETDFEIDKLDAEPMFYIESIFSSGGDETCTYDVLDGGWYHVTVPDKGKSNTIIITVDPLSGDGNQREAIIEMQAGDAFTKISIAQQ